MTEIRAHHAGEERFRKPLYQTHRINPPHLFCPLFSHPVGCRGTLGVSGEPTYICAADEYGQWLLLPHPSLALPPSKHNGTDCPCDKHSHTEGALPPYPHPPPPPPYCLPFPLECGCLPSPERNERTVKERETHQRNVWLSERASLSVTECARE